MFFSIVILLVALGSFVMYTTVKDDNNNITGATVSAPVSAEKIYKLFLCPCCGDTIDVRCCPMAKEMIDYIDAQIAAGLSEDEVIIQAVKKFGITSLVESKRGEIESKLKESNPNLFPTDKLVFRQAVGKKAPDFSLDGISGEIVKLSDYRGKNIVLFFNEGSMCYPACWNQIAELGNDERFNTNDVVAFSIVIDQKSDWEKIIKKTPGYSNAKLLFDPTRAVSSAYDVLNLPSSMHKGSYPGHTYFIIDKEGIIRYTWDDPNMALWNDRLVNELEKISGEQ